MRHREDSHLDEWAALLETAVEEPGESREQSEWRPEDEG